jgi:hypothetical protein
LTRDLVTTRSPETSVVDQSRQAVPSFLTLCMACTPCTASTSHLAWDVDIEGIGEVGRLTKRHKHHTVKRYA